MKRNLVYAVLLTAICLVLSILSMSLSGCSALNIVNPTYSVHEIRPRVDIALPLSHSGIDIDFTLGVENPNRVGIRLSRVDFDLFVNDQPMLRGYSSDQNISIPAHGFGEVHFRTRIDYEHIRPMFRQLTDLIQGHHAEYSLRGRAYYDTPLGPIRFPVNVLHREVQAH